MNRRGALLPADVSQTPVSNRDSQSYENCRIAGSSAKLVHPPRLELGPQPL